MVPPTARRVAAVVAATLLILLVAAPGARADNSVQGKLAPSPDPATPAAALWNFGGPGDGSTVTITLTYSPNGNGVDAPTQRTYDQLIGFNVYGEDGQLFGQSRVAGGGTAVWSFQSTSVHQYSVQVFNYAEASGVTYTLAAQHASLSAPVTPTPTPNFLVSPAASPTVSPTAASAPATVPTAATSSPAPSSVAQTAPPPATAAPPLPAATPPVVSGVLAKAGDQVQGHLVGALTGAVQEYRVTPTADGSRITLRLSARQGALIQNLQTTLDIYQMQGGVKVLIAVGLPVASDFTESSVTFLGGANGYGDYLADVTNSAPGQPLDFTLTRS